jgi:hypothetical protein
MSTWKLAMAGALAAFAAAAFACSGSSGAIGTGCSGLAAAPAGPRLRSTGELGLLLLGGLRRVHLGLDGPIGLLVVHGHLVEQRAIGVVTTSA